MDVDNTLRRRARAFTLVELVATLAVIAISLAIAIPGWSQIAGRSQITTTANAVLGDLRFARNAAVTRSGHVSLCPSDDGQTCSGDPRGWDRGYLVFADTDGNRRRDPNETLLRVTGPRPPGLALHSTAGRPAVRFRADGASWSTNTTFSVCHGDDPAAYRAVILLGSGRARVDRKAPGGRAISCS